MAKAVKRIELVEMPLDKFTDNHFVHATGDAVVLDNGKYVVEYEDDIYEDAENYVYIDRYGEECR